MERLPVEIYRAICATLETEDVKKLRLVSEYSRDVATPFLMSEIHLIFKQSSFDDLVAISKHPAISQSITSIYYEPDMLGTEDRSEWESYVRSSCSLDSTLVLSPNFTDEERRLHAQVVEEHKKRRQHTYTKEVLDVAWTKHQDHLRSQQDLRRQRYGIRKLQEAMPRLPKVKNFYMPMGNSFSQSDYLRRAFSAGLSIPFGDISRTRATGVPQLRSCLISMHDAGIRLQKFKCGDVSWKLFRCSKNDLNAFAATLAQVRKFRLQISTDILNARGNASGIELPVCRRFLKNGRVRDLISGADDLEKLNVRLDWSIPTFGLELANVVGDCIWPRLSKVTLSNIETTEELLIHFLERHRVTLRKVHLNTMLLALGEWPSLVPRMRSSLHLDYLVLEGSLISDVPRRYFDLGVIKWDNARIREDVHRIEKRKAIELWFKNGGHCPLTDEWSWSGE